MLLGALTCFCDLALAAGETGACLLAIHILHLYKGKQKDPNVVGSYRPVGQADPILYLLADLVQLRTGFRISQVVGPSQLGGLADSRYHIGMQRDCRTARALQGLPTFETSADARYGFDGGRHAQVLC